MNLPLIVVCLILQFISSSSSQETFHTCTLDDDNCGGKVTSNIKTDKNVLSATSATYRVTDVTSITTPTSNGELCQIPYTSAGTEHYHCKGLASSFNCITLNGEQGNCVLGQFFYIKLSTLNTERYTSAKIPIPKSANSAGKLRFSFYYLFECSGSSCKTLADSLTVSVNGQVLGELTYGNAIVERRWIQHSFDFTSSDSEIQYEIALNRPRPPAGTKNMMAFDQFELITLSDGDASSTSTLISTSTSTSTLSTVEPDQTSSFTTTKTTTTTIETSQPTDPVTSSADTTVPPVTTTTTYPATTATTDTTTTIETETSSSAIGTDSTPSTTTTSGSQHSTIITVVSTDSSPNLSGSTSSAADTSSKSTPEQQDSTQSPSPVTTNEPGDSSSSTTTTNEPGDSSSSTTTTNEPGDSSSSTTTTSNQPSFVTLAACTLDHDDLCGGRFENLSYQESQSSPIDLKYYITDVTSITKPTQNGQLCAIPFSIDDKQYFHCYSREYKCITNTGSEDLCTLGKYLSLRTVVGAKLDGSYISNKIFIPRNNGPAQLRLTFHYLFDCEQCSEIDDSITVSLSNGQSIGSLDNSVIKRQWIRRSFEFVTEETEIQFIVNLKRSRSPKIRAMIAVDNFELDILSDGPLVTTTTKPVDITTTTLAKTTTTATSQSTQSSTPTMTSTVTASTTTSDDQSPQNNNKDPDDSNLVPILLGVLIPVAFVALLVGAFIYFRKRKTKKLAENWNKGADFLTDTYALDDVADADANVNYDNKQRVRV